MIDIKQYVPESPFAGIKLAISVCSNRPITPRCALGMAMMLHHLTASGIPFALICRLQASLLPQARQECLDEAMADECTHQLWWDDDIEPPADCIIRMLQTLNNNPQVDGIASNYCRKQDTLQYTCEGLDGKMTESVGRVGIEEVGKIGMGLVMFKLDKLRGIPAPHFEVKWVDEHKRYMGEDRYFTDKLLASGVRIFVDHGLSNYTQHWGDIGYNFRLWNNPENRLEDIKPGDRGIE